MNKLHYFSLSTAPIEVLNVQDKRLSAATSFFYETEDSQLFLITNWHVVTGRHPSNQSSSKTGSVPNTLKIKVHRRQKEVDGEKTIVSSDIDDVCIPINSEDGNEPRWLEHPDFGLKVDVVGIKIEEHSEFRKKYHFTVANKWKEFHSDYEPEVMDDVFVIGYPWGLSATSGRGGGIPIYKRGSVASDPIIDFRRLPCVLIDCRTTESMSGSAVIAARTGIFMPDGQMSDSTVLGTVSMFLGIYSGRLIGKRSVEDSEKDISEIGIVWKASVLDAITQHGNPGTPLKCLAS